MQLTLHYHCESLLWFKVCQHSYLLGALSSCLLTCLHAAPLHTIHVRGWCLIANKSLLETEIPLNIKLRSKTTQTNNWSYSEKRRWVCVIPRFTTVKKCAAKGFRKLSLTVDAVKFTPEHDLRLSRPPTLGKPYWSGVSFTVTFLQMPSTLQQRAQVKLPLRPEEGLWCRMTDVIICCVCEEQEYRVDICCCHIMTWFVISLSHQCAITMQRHCKATEEGEEGKQ